MSTTVLNLLRALRATIRSFRSRVFRSSGMGGKLPVGPGRVNANGGPRGAAVPSRYGAATTQRLFSGPVWRADAASRDPVWRADAIFRDPVWRADAISRDPRGIMKTIPDVAREILSRSPTPALPLPRLVEAIAEEIGSFVVPAERILAELRSCPDLFRVLDPVIGPWRRATSRPGEVPPWSPDTWVLGLHPGSRASSPVSARTTESLRCLGRRVDENSATAVAHWILLIERATSRRDA